MTKSNFEKLADNILDSIRDEAFHRDNSDEDTRNALKISQINTLLLIARELYKLRIWFVKYDREK